jgi:hypothetical protein
LIGDKAAGALADFVLVDMFANYCTGREEAKSAIKIAERQLQAFIGKPSCRERKPMTEGALNQPLRTTARCCAWALPTHARAQACPYRADRHHFRRRVKQQPAFSCCKNISRATNRRGDQ